MTRPRNVRYAVARWAVLATIVAGCEGGTEKRCADEGAAACSGSAQSAEGSGEPDDSGARRSADAGSGAKRDAAVKLDAGTQGTNIPKNAALPCDVAAVLEKNCGTCHGQQPSYGAPIPLTTPADFSALGKGEAAQTVAQLVKTRINASDAAKRMPPVPGKLSADELATLNAWLSAGARATEAGQCATNAGVDAGPVSLGDPHTDPNLKCYKMLANAGDGKTPFGVGVALDAYYNFVFLPPWQGTVYAKVMAPVVDNKQAIHHWLLFEDDVPSVPGLPAPGSGAHPAGQLVIGWAPGGPATDLRGLADDVGYELSGGTTYTLEVHYNSSNPFAADASGIEICVSNTKPKNIAGLSWLGTDNLAIPSTSWTGFCAPASTQPIHIIGVNPHMHLQGRHIKALINRKDGTQETLHEGDFDFNYQVSYPKDVVLQPGETITTTCSFALPMTFGESTNAEMCYLFTLAYPYGALADLGGWGRFAHGGSACLGM